MGEEDLTSIFLSMRASLARAVTGIVPPKEIEDIVQETYVRACQAGSKHDIRAPRSFLYKTAHNLALDYVKKAETRLTVSGDDNPETGLWEGQRLADETFDQVSADEEFSQFCDAVRHLPVQCRRAFVLKKVYGHTQREIAQELSLSENTVEKHIAQGIKRCTYFMMQRNKGAHGIGRAGKDERNASMLKKR